MSIPQNKPRKTKHQSPQENYPDSYVVPESEIRALVGEVPFKQIDAFAARMQVIADCTTQPIEGQARNELDKHEMEMIKRVGAQDRRKRYREVMKAVRGAVERGGREGIDAAHRTARLAVQQAFRWTPEYLYALRQYENRLRAIEEITKGR
jgi:hypothetical protein